MQSKAAIIAQLEGINSQIKSIKQNAYFEGKTLEGSLHFCALKEQQTYLNEQLESFVESPIGITFCRSPLSSTRSRKSSSPIPIPKPAKPKEWNGFIEHTAWDDIIQWGGAIEERSILRNDENDGNDADDEDDRIQEDYESCGFRTSRRA